MASRRFEGAITGPTDGVERDSSRLPRPERPRRPMAIELASALLIVGGIFSTISAVAFIASGGAAVLGPVYALVLALDVLTVVVGLLIRRGRAWILAINVVAIAFFLELTALPSAFALLFIGLDAIVLYALFRHRAWFDGRRPAPLDGDDDEDPGGAEADDR
ncbi:MAG TPA: hypothetical protein VD763_08295 [Candidatus Saccharimonadales bacterium]|nr:hypothetical protein [Candidatus Saccharimonadales bacterium]